jgi:hypothetical protein
MDWRDAFNIAILVAGALGGWALRTIWDAVSSLRDTVATLERNLPETYARRDDVRHLHEMIEARFNRLEALINNFKVR